MSPTPVTNRGFGPARHAELALLLEVAGTPKPGNVDRRRDLSDLHFEHFLTGAVGAAKGLRLAESGTSVGEAFETAVAGMSKQGGGNTQFGCLLLLVPLVRAATAGDLSPDGAAAVVESTTVDDAVNFYRAFEHVNVAVGEVPDDASDLDVRHGGDAESALRDRDFSLYDVMELSADRDANAREWTGGFDRTFRAADAILVDDGPVTDRVARAFLDLLAEEPDTLVVTNHGESVARDVMDRAAAVSNLDEAEELAETFVTEGINPGTTADIACAATFVALERGVPL
ncbi:triphosphoribosyl-dephospho-CoA synthase [Haloferax mediterranei ATCC 33500]|uniref:Triphosphoribosyl-dephospho-CoA synthase n=1 Tax=Haloferax mediterranei (strain ATCC 33500 / DSM 1411 / JCM 8866 / NBRC 14739 / NCIMB 2177 / R-4) TaxID=523841 RepID=I3R7F6_HALMT|nr:triphosphoribosyl-dephospho-CoA synthase [Haloferax mediterranei]AFK20166.1 triphosphoribosyl-dephospho-CoA synthase [Haloferax mediterranei ATCC 33500]AHZ23540.1 triphosphoribosyl-dephospho-CoA synthase [Haloferax mediterranei ATCC 33500]ELZ99715.1 triphosphoribosyl-dephospho-CoA synthase [Haloferax mediterranei ATCC 33500]MDX5987081.1 triphosphoribosyl-dephospho-CoA synthase [Haloferax mediterranei ATCC 33500]QCQ76396.1 triphosphoribosyl-dephospho-CoA synthase [Haloferax mediterranei ATCC